MASQRNCAKLCLTVLVESCKFRWCAQGDKEIRGGSRFVACAQAKVKVVHRWADACKVVLDMRRGVELGCRGVGLHVCNMHEPREGQERREHEFEQFCVAVSHSMELRPHLRNGEAHGFAGCVGMDLTDRLQFTTHAIKQHRAILQIFISSLENLPIR